MNDMTSISWQKQHDDIDNSIFDIYLRQRRRRLCDNLSTGLHEKLRADLVEMFRVVRLHLVQLRGRLDFGGDPDQHLDPR